jgi:hypothetical protein
MLFTAGHFGLTNGQRAVHEALRPDCEWIELFVDLPDSGQQQSPATRPPRQAALADLVSDLRRRMAIPPPREPGPSQALRPMSRAPLPTMERRDEIGARTPAVMSKQSSREGDFQTSRPVP